MLYPWDECRYLESTIGYEAEKNINDHIHHPNQNCVVDYIRTKRKFGENDL